MTTHYTITTTRTKVADVPACPAMHTRIETRTRKPESRAHTVDIPTSAWHAVTCETIPTQFRALVEAALLDSAEAVLSRFVTNTATRGNASIPASLFTLEALLANSATARMTVATLLGMWRNSSKYVLDVAPKLTEYEGSRLLKYKANIERHEKRLAALASKSPETSLSADDLDKLLTNLHDSDADSAYGNYLADRTEEVRAKLTEDGDAL